MKKLVFVILIIFGVSFSYADQLAWITKDQAEKTVAYFEDEDIEQVVLWCACCDSDSKVKVNIDKIIYKKTEDPAYYEIYIVGKSTGGKTINMPVDLAYVHIKRSGKWRCLGKELKFECDPCTEPFKM